MSPVVVRNFLVDLYTGNTEIALKYFCILLISYSYTRIFEVYVHMSLDPRPHRASIPAPCWGESPADPLVVPI